MGRRGPLGSKAAKDAEEVTGDGVGPWTQNGQEIGARPGFWRPGGSVQCLVGFEPVPEGPDSPSSLLPQAATPGAWAPPPRHPSPHPRGLQAAMHSRTLRGMRSSRRRSTSPGPWADCSRRSCSAASWPSWYGGRRPASWSAACRACTCSSTWPAASGLHRGPLGEVASASVSPGLVGLSLRQGPQKEKPGCLLPFIQPQTPLIRQKAYGPPGHAFRGAVPVGVMGHRSVQ